MTCPSASDLARFVDGGLSDRDGAHIEAHLDRCVTCREVISTTARLDARVAPTLSSGESDSIAARTMPARVGRYELIAPIGAGAMGVVYAAYDPDLDRRVAIKLLADRDGDDSTRRARLAREARTLAKISHPNVVPVHDVGVADDHVFVAMELVAGDNLRAHVATNTSLSIAERLALIVQAARGLAAAHAVGITHRDFKPDNVLVGTDGRVRVGDFGLAGAGDARSHDLAPDHQRAGDAAPNTRITRSGTLMGTPAYMAPEQLRGEPTTPASDQFALCVTAWELLCGERPFSGQSVPELVDAMSTSPPAASAATPAQIVAVLKIGLAMDPAARYRDVDTLIAALEARPPPRRSRRRIAGGVAAAAIATGAVVVLAMQATGGASDARDATCDAAGALSAWQPAHRIELAGAFMRTGSPLARDAFLGTERAFDRFADSYTEIARVACTTNDAALARCLSSRADDVAALLAVLSHVDANALPRSVSSVLAMESPESCRSSSARPRIAVPGLANVRALRRAGRYHDALAAAATLSSTDPAGEADLEIERGISATAIGKLDDARDHLSRAAARADTARDDRLRAEALVQAVKVVGDHAVDLQESARLEDQARAAVERAGSPARLRAELLEALGNASLRRGDLAHALELYDTAIASYKAEAHSDDVHVASAMVAAAGVRAQLGKPDQALAEFTTARELATRALGASHPNVGVAWIGMLEPLAMLKRFPKAIDAGRQAIAIFESSPSTSPATLASAHMNLAIVLHFAERDGEAIASLLRALPLLEGTVGRDHPEVATLLLNLAAMYKDAERYDEAMTTYERVMTIWEAKLGPRHVDLARPLTALGEIALARHRPKAALPLLERALSIREHAGANVPATHVAHTRELLAEARRQLEP